MGNRRKRCLFEYNSRSIVEEINSLAGFTDCRVVPTQSTESMFCTTRMSSYISRIFGLYTISGISAELANDECDTLVPLLNFNGHVAFRDFLLNILVGMYSRMPLDLSRNQNQKSLLHQKRLIRYLHIELIFLHKIIVFV